VAVREPPPPVTVHRTVAPLTALPFESLTTTTKNAPSWAHAAAVWLLPEAYANVVVCVKSVLLLVVSVARGGPAVTVAFMPAESPDAARRLFGSPWTSLIDPPARAATTRGSAVFPTKVSPALMTARAGIFPE